MEEEVAVYKEYEEIVNLFERMDSFHDWPLTYFSYDKEKNVLSFQLEEVENWKDWPRSGTSEKVFRVEFSDVNFLEFHIDTAFHTTVDEIFYPEERKNEFDFQLHNGFLNVAADTVVVREMLQQPGGKTDKNVVK